MLLTPWILTSALAILTIVEGSLGLRLKNLEVPRHADVGTSVLLSCSFELDKNLYSVKWYKDDYEFYRFMPDNTPKSQIFPVEGIHLDTSMSDINNVKLDMVEYKTSGTYKCEVSTEGPAFDTVFRSKNMSVLAYPDRPPMITGHQQTYSIGDYITVNCTSGRSNPEPILAWYINGIKADSYLLDHSSPKMSHINPDPIAGLVYSRSLGMRTRAEKNMFPGSKASVNLKCTSTVADMPPQYAVVEPRLASASANQKLAQEMSSSSGALNRVSFILLLVIIFRVDFST